ncbi:MAG TPA: matrixin family metalloprotease [Longimicrobium sp.]|nr:matrixin family metalloprotease [Longimicrobium sp.]
MSSINLSAIRNAALLASLAAAVFAPRSAEAYELLTANGACPGGIERPADVSLTVNTANAASFAEAIQYLAAASEIADRISNVGGQWFDYTTPYTSSSAAFPAPNWNGVDETGLADISALGASVIGWGPSDVNTVTCKIEEGDAFLSSNHAWLFNTPSYYGDDYFNAEKHFTYNGVYSIYGRGTLIHELGHTLGLAHAPASYSYMNYGNRPWSNRATEKQVELLPDDREALRDLYPAATTEIDLAIYNTWYEAATSGPADAKLLCRPSGGTAFSPDKFDAYCGVTATGASGPTAVCPGDRVYLRYAITNFGTSAITFNEEAWFSADKTLDTASDTKSSTVGPAVTLGAQSSLRTGRSFIVPTTPTRAADYYILVHLNSGATLVNEESQQNNAIPMRIPLRIKAAFFCPP